MTSIRTTIPIFLAAAALCAGAAGASPPTGRWMGASEALAPARFLELEVTSSGEELMATLDAYAEVALEFDTRFLVEVPVEPLSWNEGRLEGSFVVRGEPWRLVAGVSRDEIVGTLAGAAESHPLRLVRIADDASSTVATGVYADAAGELLLTRREYGGLRLIDLESGVSRTLFAAPGGGLVTRRSVRDPEWVGERLEPLAGGSGLRWSRPGAAPRELRRLAGFAQEEIAFASGETLLAGTVMRPAGTPRGPVPGVVLVHGSGPIYRTALAEQAVMFARLGATVLLYDKRGTGASEGEWRSASFADLAADALAAVRILAARPGVDAGRVGLQGHSQAGFVIPIAAGGHPEVAFAAIVSGGPIDPAEQALYDKRHDLRREGFDATTSRRALALLDRVHAWVLGGAGDRESLERDYLAALDEPWFAVLDLPRLASLPSWDDPPAFLLAAREELSYDGSPWVRRMEGIPILVILGAEDETVPPAAAAAAWREALPPASSDRLRVEIVPGADHALRVAGEGGMRPRSARYAEIHREWWERRVLGEPEGPAGGGGRASGEPAER